MSRLARHPFALLVISMLAGACAPQNTQTAASPVVGSTRRTELGRGESGIAFEKRGDDGVVVAKMVAPVATVWSALGEAFAAHSVKPTINDLTIGRMGDTALVLLRKWNGHQLSQYFTCGSTMTGPRADEERIRAVLLAQLSRLPADTIAVAVHLSGISTPVTGSGSSRSTCTTTGQAEKALLDEVVKRSGAVGVR
jgi:hypothetical protein